MSREPHVRPAAALAGVSFAAALAPWLPEPLSGIELLELRAEHFFKSGKRRLRELGAQRALALRGASLSLGTAGPLDRHALDSLARVVELARPLWLSEPVGFWRTSEMAIAGVCPIRHDLGNLHLLAEHAREAAETCRARLLLENVASPLRIPGTLAETEFLNRLAEAAACGLLVDLPGLVVQSLCHGFDAGSWLRDIAPERIGALRLGPCARRWSTRLGEAVGAVHERSWQLAREALVAARPTALVLAYDDGLPHPEDLTSELQRLAQLVAEAAGSDVCAG